MPAEFDNMMKKVFWQRLPDFGPLVHVPAGDVVEPLPTNLPITLDADFVLGVGSPRRAAIDLNFQTTWDADTPIRAFVYNALLHRHFGVPIHTVIIQMRSRQNDLRLAHGVRYSVFAGLGHMEFQPEVINLREVPLEPMLTGGLGLLPLAPLCRMPDDQTREQALPEILRRINGRLNDEATPELRDSLWNSTYTLSGLYFRGEEVRPQFERYQIMRESMTYQATLEEGRVEGRVEGRMEGLAEGSFLALRQMVFLLGARKFGQAPARFQNSIDTIRDAERLSRMAQAVIDATSWQEIVDTQ